MKISSIFVAFLENMNFKYETIETHARAFLTLNILAIGRVCRKYESTYVPKLELKTVLGWIFI